jgi:integrase
MRRRFQKGSLQKVDGAWIARWREDGVRKARTLGRVSMMPKAKAQSELALILAPINLRFSSPAETCTFGDFVEHVYFPFYRRKWKGSTARENMGRVRHHLTGEFAAESLKNFRRDGLQSLLDRKAGMGRSFSVVDHLKWDLNQIFEMAVAEGYLRRNPAELLFTPRECRRPETRTMTFEEVRLLFSVLDVRERLIAKLGVLAGMRPGEIFGLTWARLESQYADIRQRVYRGEVDSPKTFRSNRWAALADGLRGSIEEWRAISLNNAGDAWVFPSERSTPLSKDNCWRRHFFPRLSPVGMAWANFQVMRRTHSSLMDDIGIDPQVRADQMGHTVDVNENVYTQASFGRRRDAVNALEKAIEQIM